MDAMFHSVEKHVESARATAPVVATGVCDDIVHQKGCFGAVRHFQTRIPASHFQKKTTHSDGFPPV